MTDDLINRTDVAAAIEDYCSDMPDLAGHGHSVGLLDVIRDMPAAQVSVRQLEWREDRNGVHSAKCICGEYSVGFDDGWWAQLEGPDFWAWDAPEDPRLYHSPFAAKAAAQADYEARIRSALTVDAPNSAVEEIDLRAVMMTEIEKAAEKSPWVPPEYAMNEVVSDCCAFLTEPRLDPAQIRAQALREAANVDWTYGRDVPDAAPEFLTPWQRGLVAGQHAMRDAILALIDTPVDASATPDPAVNADSRQPTLADAMLVPEVHALIGRRLYVDLDGVMADFDAHFPAVFGLDHRSLADDDMWAKINAHPSYFEDMPLCQGAAEFFADIRHMRPIILTACPRTNYAHVAGQKRRWVQRHLGSDVTVTPVMGGHNKCLFMHSPGDILIDDYEKNCKPWEKAGGVAIQHRSFDATRAALAAMKGGAA